MKKIIKSLIIIMILTFKSFAQQNVMIGNNNVRVSVSVSQINDTLHLLKCEMQNLTFDSLLFCGVNEFYFKLSSKENPYLYLNAGLFQKSYYSRSHYPGLIKLAPKTSVVRYDTLFLLTDTHKILFNLSVDYIRYDRILRGKIKIDNSVKSMPDIFFIKQKDYEEFGDFMETTTLLQIGK